MYLQVDDGNELELSKLEHHIDWLLDLDNWPEINSVYGVKAELVELEDVSSDLRKTISAFCRFRVNQNLCNDGDCFLCPLNEAYEMARDHDDEGEEE